MTRFVVDDEWVRGVTHEGSGRGVLAGSPPTWFSVTPAGSAILDALESGATLPAGHEPLTSRLLARGAVHPLPGDPVDTDRITVVVPARVDAAGAAQLDDLVARLAPLRVVVVDDGSTPPLTTPGADVVPHVGTSGPGPARDIGLDSVTTEVVAFVDADASIDAEGIRLLASLVVEGMAAIVAPRVASTHAGRIGPYETRRSPLDMGRSRALVRPFSRVSYLPAAVLVCATATVRDLGGFDGALRWGEDVDLVWRATQKGAACRYEPGIVAVHRPRTNLARFVAQRFRYGTSAGPLGRRHGGIVTPLRTNLALLAMSAAWLTLWWQAAVLLTALVWLWFTIGLGRTGLSLRDRTGIAARALARGIAHTASAVRRVWWPMVVVAAPFTDRALIALVVSFGAAFASGLVTDRPRDPVRWIVMRALDDLAYGAGVWRGAVAARSARCLVPVVSLRPARVG